MLRRCYYVYDANLHCVGKTWVDLDDSLLYLPTIFEEDLRRALGAQRQILRGRVTEEIRRGSVDSGVFAAGEHPGWESR